MAFESEIEYFDCKGCGAEHSVRWHRITVRDQVTLHCKGCGEIMLQANTVRDYDEPVLVRRA